MVSSGEIVREHSGHVAGCGSAIEAPRWQRGTDGPAARGHDASSRHPGWLQGLASGRIASKQSPHVPHGGALMVKLILTNAQLTCLKAAVTIGSEESAVRGQGVRFGSQLISHEPFAVKCTSAIAMRLLAVASRFCPRALAALRAA